MHTMTDIAVKSGVSRATVSLVLNERHADLRISEETQRRVLAAAKTLGYRRNRLARAVVTGNSRVLGLLTAAPEAASSGSILSGSLDEAQAQGYFVKIFRLRNDRELDAATLEQCLELRLMGVLVLYLGGQGLERLRSTLQAQRIPLAVADDVDVRQSRGAHILADYALAMEQGVAHLHALGHRRMTLLTGLPARGLPARERENAFRAALRRRGLSAPGGSVISRSGDAETLQDAARKILRAPDAPTAIIAGTDIVGLLVQRAARAMNLRMPRDLSVLCLGNLNLGEWADPALTCVAQPFYQMGRAAVRHLLQRLPGKNACWSDPPVLERLPTKLIIRSSTAAAVVHPEKKTA